MLGAAARPWYRNAVHGYRTIIAAALAGLGSGLLATVLEIAVIPRSDLGASLALSLLGTIAPIFTAAGLVLGTVLAVLRRVAAAATRLLRRSLAWEPVLTAALAGLLSAPALVVLLHELRRGRRAAEILGPLHIQVALIAGGVVLVFGLALLGLQIGRRVHRSEGRTLPLIVALLLLGLGQALFHADAELYERLYLQLHYVLLGGYLLAGLLGLLALWRAIFPAGRPSWRPGRRLASAFAVGILLLATGGAAASRHALVVDQHLRYCALELAVVSSKLLLLLPLEVPSEAPVFLQSASRPGAQRKGELSIPDANVVIVSVDALRPDHLGSYGYGRPTSPNIDALAARSIRFENAYCQVPLTCYSVPSLHTGAYVRSTLPILPKPPPTLARILASRGYTTAAFFNSTMFFCDDEKATAFGANRFGFEYAETPHREAEALTDQVLSYLREFSGSGKRKLYLWVHYFDAHEPYEAREQFPFGPDSVDRYDSEIAHVDLSVGRLVAAIAELPGPTVFVLTSDHGEEFKEHGGYYHGSSLYEEQVRVPLIIGVPGARPQVMRTPVQLVDVVPTLLGLLGQPQPDSVNGRSLVPLLTGKEDLDRAAYIEVHTKRAVRHRDWKLIDDYRRGTQELYDLSKDPGERVNLASRRPGEVDRMRALLQRWNDQLRAVATAVEKDRPEGIELGRIGDRRAWPLLTELLLNIDAKPRWRREAARLIGQLQEGRAAEALWQAVGDDDRQVAAEAAIALGEVKDRRARAVLPPVMDTTDIETRLRAGIALGRVDSPEATPALIQALWSSNWEIQNRAAHYLGFVGDRRALAALLRAASLAHLRPRLGLALGRLGLRVKDRRVMQVLLDWVRDDPHLETRLRALAGLGFLGDRRAIRPLARLLALEPDLLWVAEALTRIGGIGSYWVPGVDFNQTRRGLGKEGWGNCVNHATILIDDFREASWCTMMAAQAGLQLSLQRRPFRAEVQLRVRPLESWLKGRSVRLSLNGRDQPPVTLQGGWQVIRLLTDAKLWRQGRNQVRIGVNVPPGRRLEKGGLLAVDYMLLVPREGA